MTQGQALDKLRAYFPHAPFYHYPIVDEDGIVTDRVTGAMVCGYVAARIVDLNDRYAIQLDHVPTGCRFASGFRTVTAARCAADEFGRLLGRIANSADVATIRQHLPDRWRHYLAYVVSWDHADPPLRYGDWLAEQEQAEALSAETEAI